MLNRVDSILGMAATRGSAMAAADKARQARGRLNLDAESDILNNAISLPIERGEHGRPSVILHIEGAKLSARQQALGDKLPEYDSRVTIRKSEVSMVDLSALTAKTGVEYAMFTKGHERLIVRGNAKHVNITPENAAKLSAQGYKLSGHTHVGLYDG